MWVFGRKGEVSKVNKEVNILSFASVGLGPYDNNAK